MNGRKELSEHFIRSSHQSPRHAPLLESMLVGPSAASKHIPPIPALLTIRLEYISTQWGRKLLFFNHMAVFVQVHMNSRRPFHLSVYANTEVLLKPLPNFAEEMGVFCNTFTKEVSLPSAEETLQLIQRVWVRSTSTIPLTLQMHFDSIHVAR